MSNTLQERLAELRAAIVRGSGARIRHSLQQLRGDARRMKQLDVVVAAMELEALVCSRLEMQPEAIALLRQCCMEFPSASRYFALARTLHETAAWAQAIAAYRGMFQSIGDALNNVMRYTFLPKRMNQSVYSLLTFLNAFRRSPNARLLRQCIVITIIILRVTHADYRIREAVCVFGVIEYDVPSEEKVKK